MNSDYMKHEKGNELSIGRCGEYLVMFDLLSKGHKAFMTEQGINYDIVLEHNNRLIRLQVKTTLQPMYVNTTYKTKSYLFHVRRAGKGGKRLYNVGEFEGFALVTLDTKKVYYHSFTESINKTLIFRVPGLKYGGEHGDRDRRKRKSPYISELTLERFLQDI